MTSGELKNRTRGDRLRYRFDNLMGSGPRPLFVGLIISFLAAFGLLALLRIIAVNLLGVGPVERGDGPLRQIYITFLEVTDPGSMTQDVESGLGVKLFAVLSGMVGLVLLSALIAFITTALDERLRELRRGRSAVIAADHTILLGWNERIADIVRELVLANESQDDSTLVILADRSKEDMDEYLKSEVPNRRGTTVVTRRGNPAVLTDLRLTSLSTCRSVIVLADCSVASSTRVQHDSDISVIKRVLAAFAASGQNFDAPIVCEVFRQSERRIIERIAPGQIVAIDAADILAKILVQTSRSSGLSAVYEEVLSFEGSEIYLLDSPAFADLTFGQTALRFHDGVPLGFVRQGMVRLNPDPSDQLLGDDRLVVVASDDSALNFEDKDVADEVELVLSGLRLARQPERVLVIGWTPKTETILREYDDYLLSGSEITVISRSGQDLTVRLAELAPSIPNITLRAEEIDPLDIEQLRSVAPEGFDEVILLSQSRDANGTELTTDSETIVILLLLRQLLDDAAGSSKLITEILDSANGPLVRHVGGHDVIVSNQLVSNIAAQLSEEPALQQVFATLFSEEGSEFYLKPIDFYCAPGIFSFATLMGIARQRGEIAIGYRRMGEHENEGVTLVPAKNHRIQLDSGDSLVVLAEDDQ